MMTVMCAIEMCLQARDIDNLGTKILSTRGFHSDFALAIGLSTLFSFSRVSRSTPCLHETLRLLCNYDDRPTRSRTRDFESKGTKHHDASCEYRLYLSSAHTSLPIDQAQSDLGVDRRTNQACLGEAHTRCN